MHTIANTRTHTHILGNVLFYFGHPTNILPRTGGTKLKASGAYPNPFAKKVALAHKAQGGEDNLFMAI